MYIGFMYSMCAFGPVCGFLLGAYLLSHNVDTFSTEIHINNIGNNFKKDQEMFSTFILGMHGIRQNRSNFLHIPSCFSDSSDRRWIGMWWGGFLICGASLIVISIPFFFFPKELKVSLEYLAKGKH